MTDVFTLQEFASNVQEDVDTATATEVRARATAIVKQRAPRAFRPAGVQTVLVNVVRGLARLPRPVENVTSVQWVVEDDSRIPATGWTFDGIDTIADLLDTPTGSLSTPRSPTTIEVTYTGGYAAVPADVRSIVLALAIRMYRNPADLESTSFTAGAYSETERHVASADGPSSQLLPAEIAALRPYRRRTATVRLG